MSLSRMRWVLGTVVVAAVGWCAVPSWAQEGDRDTASPLDDSDSSLQGEVLILHATNDGGGVDPAIGKLPELAEPPFSSYDTYKLLSRKDTPLKRGEPSKTTLPNGRVLGVTYEGPAKAEDGPARYRLKATIQKKKEGEFLPLLAVNAPAGKYFFVAGQKYKGGILVIGIKVKK